jgi:hypothetical protein
MTYTFTMENALPMEMVMTVVFKGSVPIMHVTMHSKTYEWIKLK